MERDATGPEAQTPPESLENQCYRNLAVGGAFLVIGLAMTLTVMLAWWGVPLIVLGGIIIAVSVIQALRQLRERGIEVSCPYCRKQYRVMPDLRHLLCDECQKEIPLTKVA
jgi:hypothetical protein